MTDQKTPQYMKDETGFCYVYTEHLAVLPELTPYDGAIDKNGYAVDAVDKKKQPKQTAPE